MKSILGLVQQAPCRVDVEFKDANGHPYKTTATVKGKGTDTEELALFTNKDTIQGEVRVTPATARKLDHQGIKVQLVGQIELANERGQYHDFVSLDRNLAAPGDLMAARTFPFEFRNVEMLYDSYRGQHVRCRYLLRVLVAGKGLTQDTKKEVSIWVRNYDVPAEASVVPIKMEVGIEDCLHIEFEYDKAKYHLKDVVVGKIYFLLVRIKLKHMELEIRRRETTGAGASSHSESETLAKYEIMDGAPVRGENIPIRLYLSPYELTPTYKEVHNKFSVRYFLNLVLIDEEDRRYFKQQEITLYRQADLGANSARHASGAGPARLPSNANRASAWMEAAVASTAAAASGAGTATTNNENTAASSGGGAEAVGPSGRVSAFGGTGTFASPIISDGGTARPGTGTSGTEGADTGDDAGLTFGESTLETVEGSADAAPLLAGSGNGEGGPPL